MNKQALIDILSNGENRPLSVPNPQARLEYVSRVLTEIADWMERMAKNNPDFAPTLIGYKKSNEVREQVLNIADIALLLNEFYALKQDAWTEFNAEYIAKGE